MCKKRPLSPEHTINKLRHANSMLVFGESVSEVLQPLEIGEAAWSRRRSQ
jgi:hypothetical protein